MKVFLPYELGKLAIRKGFDEFWDILGSYCENRRSKEIHGLSYSFTDTNQNFQQWNWLKDFEPAPTHQQVMNWLIDKFKIRFKIEPTIQEKVEIFYSNKFGWNYIGIFDEDYQALNKGIEIVLNLLEDEKNG